MVSIKDKPIIVMWSIAMIRMDNGFNLMQEVRIVHRTVWNAMAFCSHSLSSMLVTHVIEHCCKRFTILCRITPNIIKFTRFYRQMETNKTFFYRFLITLVLSDIV